MLEYYTLSRGYILESSITATEFISFPEPNFIGIWHFPEHPLNCGNLHGTGPALPLWLGRTAYLPRLSQTAELWSTLTRYRARDSTSSADQTSLEPSPSQKLGQTCFNELLCSQRFSALWSVLTTTAASGGAWGATGLNIWREMGCSRLPVSSKTDNIGSGSICAGDRLTSIQKYPLHSQSCW